MMRIAFVCRMGIIMIVLSMILLGQAWAESKVFVHFLVVPAKTKDGRDFNTAMADLKLKLARLAGGYTHLGPSEGGYLPSGGKLEQKKNHSFIVSAPRNITKDLEDYIPQYFETTKPYVLVWEAVCNY